ncbi:MAG: hypothetical protein HY650_09605 [Acidobacteria bacterium]|nr:hypothetical protein [Acidobacteriota bacterium]
MRRILVDHARSHRYKKRGGGALRVSLDEMALVSEESALELVELDNALSSLAAFDERKCRIVELRFFGGLSAEEAPAVMGISRRTVAREWRMAKAWLHREISKTVTSDEWQAINDEQSDMEDAHADPLSYS